MIVAPLVSVPLTTDPVTDPLVIRSMVEFAITMQLVIELDYTNEKGERSTRAVEVREFDSRREKVLTFCRMRDRDWRWFKFSRIHQARWTAESFAGMPQEPGPVAANGQPSGQPFHTPKLGQAPAGKQKLLHPPLPAGPPIRKIIFD